MLIRPAPNTPLSSSRSYWPYLLLLFVVLGSLLLVLFQPPFGQDLNYHDFADKRAFLGVPNFLDVFTNLPFAFVGIAGVWFYLHQRSIDLNFAWLSLFAGTALVSVGSAYYHLAPSNATLVWDRLPMSFGFMGLLVAFLGEYIHPRLSRVLLVPALLFGAWSVMHWHWFDDLRLYAWVQMLPVLIIPVVMVFFQSRYSHQGLLLVAISCYILAKFAEAFDRDVFVLSQELISGHSLKHLWAALGGLVLLWMLKSRRVIRSEDP